MKWIVVLALAIGSVSASGAVAPGNENAFQTTRSLINQSIEAVNFYSRLGRVNVTVQSQNDVKVHLNDLIAALDLHETSLVDLQTSGKLSNVQYVQLCREIASTRLKVRRQLAYLDTLE
jgi:hypothetical protein